MTAPSTRESARLTHGPTDIERSRWAAYSLEHVAAHNVLEDGWIVIHGRVYDITAFAITHPGFNNAGQVSTALAIARNLGKDATREFEQVHSNTAWVQLRDFQIGVVARPTDVPTLSDPLDHPVPPWLEKDRTFWVQYAGGVPDDVLRYLEAQGYPQKKGGAKVPEWAKGRHARRHDAKSATVVDDDDDGDPLGGVKGGHGVRGGQKRVVPWVVLGVMGVTSAVLRHVCRRENTTALA